MVDGGFMMKKPNWSFVLAILFGALFLAVFMVSTGPGGSAFGRPDRLRTRRTLAEYAAGVGGPGGGGNGGPGFGGGPGGPGGRGGGSLILIIGLVLLTVFGVLAWIAIVRVWRSRPQPAAEAAPGPQINLGQSASQAVISLAAV